MGTTRGNTVRKIWIASSFAAVLLVGCDKAGKVRDEAMRAGRPPESFPAAGEDYFKPMDNGTPFSDDEVKGRNMWIVWTGGNDRFWDVLTNDSFGAFDLLKTLSSYPGLKFSRDNRWNYLGLVNEPCFEKASGPDPNRYGLWLDHRRADCRSDPFEDEAKCPGVKIGARGKTVPVGSYYGNASGIVGLRLFPNPAFDEEAKKNWDPDKFYSDPSYYQSKKLVRLLRSEGFTVGEGSGEMPTAFAARWGKSGPVLGTYAEYDAVRAAGLTTHRMRHPATSPPSRAMMRSPGRWISPPVAPVPRGFPLRNALRSLPPLGREPPEDRNSESWLRCAGALKL
jgi:hypothetical protein